MALDGEWSENVFESILLPLDGSPLAEAALPAAGQVAKRFGAKLFLLEVLPPADVGAWMAPGRDNAPEGQKQLLEHDRELALEYLSAKVLSLKGDDINAEAIVKVGNPVDEILGSVTAMEISLIVMATHGRGGLSKLILGSVAEKVLHHCHIPVMIVRPQ